MAEIHLSVVIPAFNEENRIAGTLGGIIAFLKQQSWRAELIVVDDGSRDGTVAAAQKELHAFRSHGLMQVLENGQNRGKGFSVRRGMLAASGRFVLFSDADLSTPIEEVSGFIAALESGYDVVIGSRALPDSRIKVRQNLLRESMGKTFNRFARLFAFSGIHDSQCGFKCFRREAAQKLFSLQKLDGFSFDAEILYLAQKLGCRILESPVAWTNSPKSRVRILRDPLEMFCDLMKIRWLHRHD